MMMVGSWHLARNKIWRCVVGTESHKCFLFDRNGSDVTQWHKRQENYVYGFSNKHIWWSGLMAMRKFTTRRRLRRKYFFLQLCCCSLYFQEIGGNLPFNSSLFMLLPYTIVDCHSLCELNQTTGYWRYCRRFFLPFSSWTWSPSSPSPPPARSTGRRRAPAGAGWRSRSRRTGSGGGAPPGGQRSKRTSCFFSQKTLWFLGLRFCRRQFLIFPSTIVSLFPRRRCLSERGQSWKWSKSKA